MLDINLLTAVKRRVIYELRSAINENLVFKGTEVYHKFPYTERPARGIVLRSTTSSRIKLSPDDFAYTMKSYVALARAENHGGKFMQWVWENQQKTTAYQENEDLSSQITGTATNGTNRFFYTSRKPLLGGYNNDTIVDNFRQIELKLNGEVVHAEFVDGSRGMIVLSMAPVVGDTLTVSYYYGIMSAPGRYYVEIVPNNQFVVDPLLQIKGEEVIELTTGTELTASLDHSGLYGDFDVLYLTKGIEDDKLTLERGTDYTVTSGGVITFLQPLSVGYTLLADYRYVAPTLGPFPIPDPNHYDDAAIPGVLLCFNKQVEVGDKVVVIVYPERQVSASVYMGHYRMTFDIDVFSRHPEETSEMTDHVIHEIWGNRRFLLIDEGLTIEEMDQTGETEDVYDTNTNDLWYKQSISLQMMTEWKKFVPALWDIQDYDTALYAYIKTSKYVVTPDNRVLELQINPLGAPFEVKYPKTGYPRYM